MAAMRGRPVIWLATACLLASCGPPRYLPFRIIQPHSADGVSVQFDSLEFQVRAGAEWLELRVANRSGVPRAVDLGQIIFIGSGLPHEVVTQSRIGLDVLQQASYDQPFEFAAVRYTPFNLHVRPPLLQQPQSAAHLLPPGTYFEELLYPAEHLAFEGVRFSASELFCRGDPSERQRFELIIPVLHNKEWIRFRLVAERFQPERDL